MASYCDKMLRDSNLKSLDDKEIWAKIEEIDSLILTLNDKNSFIKAYQCDLADRLMTKTMIYKDAEHMMLH